MKPSAITLGTQERIGVLFTDYVTGIVIPNDHWFQQVLSQTTEPIKTTLVHQRFSYGEGNSEPKLDHTHEIILKNRITPLFLLIDANQQELIDYHRKTLSSIDYYNRSVYHKWWIRLEAGERRISIEIVLICERANLPNNAFEYLSRTCPFVCRDFGMFEEGMKLFEHLFNKDCDYKKFFGRNYPLVYQVKDDQPSMIGNGLNNMSIQNSFSRFARIFMDLHLGKCVMIVKFELNHISGKYFEETERIKNAIKKKWCKEGIIHDGHCYKFFSTSNSGMKGSSAVFVNSTLLNFETVKQLLGTFEKAQQTGGVRKVASRIGLNMGTSVPSLAKLRNDEIFILPKEIEDKFPITDGAGLAIDDFFEEILEQTYSIPYFELEKLALHPEMKESRRIAQDYKNVSAIQVRLLGSKGVLQKIPKSLWKELQLKWKFSDSTKVILRNSMIKFDESYYKKIDVLNYSSLQGGNISSNAMTCLLQMTDHKQEMEEIFYNDLVEYVKEMEDNRNDPTYVCNKLLNGTGNTREGIVKQLLLAKHPLNNYFIENVIRENIKTKLLALVDEKLSFKIKNSHCISLMAVVDESLELKEGEVYIHSDNFSTSSAYQEIDEILVYRNPLGYEGDIQKFKIKKDPKGEFLKSRRNVIVFSKSSSMAPLCFMSGGDMDGDLYNIIFHPKIVEYFNPNAKPKLDYTSDEIYKKYQDITKPILPVNNSLEPATMDQVIHEHINMFTETSQLGILSMYTIALRESEDIEMKLLASKLYADCIDSIKGAAYHGEFAKILHNCKLPEWYQQLKDRVSDNKESFWEIEGGNQYTDHIVSRLFKFVEESLQKLTRNPQTITLDPDFQKLDPNYSKYYLEWQEHFEVLYKEWSQHSQKSETSEPTSRTHKRKLLNKIKETLPEMEVDRTWVRKFMENTDGIDMRCEKAAYFMWYLQNAKVDDQVERLKSTFVYNCCLIFLNSFKLFKVPERAGKPPQVISNNFTVSFKNTITPISRTTRLE